MMTQPHYIDRACQKCGGEIQGWTCQGCGQVFRENDAGALVFAPMEAVAWGYAYRRRSFEDGIPLEDAPWNLTMDDDGFLMMLKADPEHWEVQSLAVIPTEGLGSSLRDTHREAEGAVLVPREPTTAMLQGACDKHTPGQPMSKNRPDECPRFETRRRIWRKMVDAALAAPASDTKGGENP